MSPLLFQLSEELEIPIKFYGFSAQAGPAKSNLVASIVTGMTWCPRPVKEFLLTDISEYLQNPVYFVASTSDFRTREQVLKHVSNKEGGAHYDEQTVAIVDALNRVQVGYKNAVGTEYVRNGVQLFLTDLSALVYWAGMRLGYSWNAREKHLDEAEDPRIAKIDDQFEEKTRRESYFIAEMFTEA